MGGLLNQNVSDPVILDKPMVLLGENAFSRQLARMLAEIGVAASVQPFDMLDVPSSQAVMSPSALNILCWDYPLSPSGIPQPIAQTRKTYATILLETIALRPDARVLHPCALGELFWPKMRFDGRALLFGHPGAGNSITSRIIFALYRLAHHRRLPNHLTEFFTTLHMDFFAILQQAMLGADIGAKEANIGTSLVHQTTCDLWLQNGQRVLIYNIPFSHIAFQPFTVLHDIPQKKQVEDLKQKGYDIFFCARHPFDILVSRMKFRGAGETSDADMYKHPILFFAGVFHRLRLFSEVMAGYGRVKYEELIDKPQETILRIAGALNVSVSGEEANVIWESLAFRQLDHMPSGHFGGGGHGGWRKQLGDKQLSMLAALGYAQLLQDYGYQDGLEELHHADKAYGIHMLREFDRELQADRDNDRNGIIPNLYSLHCQEIIPYPAYSPGNILMFSEDAAPLGELTAVLERNHIFQLLTCGRLTHSTCHYHPAEATQKRA